MKPKILFYTSTARAFHTYLSYALKNIDRDNVSEIILASEYLYPRDIQEINGKAFNVSEIVQVRQFTHNTMNRYRFNKYAYKMAKDLLEKYKPEIIMVSSDMGSLFEMYLLRMGQKMGAKTVAIQWSIIDSSKKVSEWTDLLIAHSLFSPKIPFWVRLFLTKARKWLGHYLIYNILPLTVFQKPFGNKSSYILKRGVSGMRDADVQIVLSERDRDLFVKEGVRMGKIEVGKPWNTDLISEDLGTKIATLVVPSEMNGAITREGKKYITKKQQEDCWIDIAKTVSKTLPEWKLYIRCHPETRNAEELKDRFRKIGHNIYWSESHFPINDVLKKSDLIVGCPPSHSTVLYMASVQFPKKNIVAIDYFNEIMGDYYKDFEKIAYVQEKNQLIIYLNQIR